MTVEQRKQGPWRSRGLTEGEKTLARRVFGDQLRLETVRFIGSPWPFDRAGDNADAYGYVADDNCRWAGLNIEQQAMVVEDAYRLSEGETVKAAAAFYRSIAPFPCGLAETAG